MLENALRHLFALCIVQFLLIWFAFLAAVGIKRRSVRAFELYRAPQFVILHMLCRISAIACDIPGHFAAVIDFSVAVADDERVHGGERPDPALLCVKAGQRCSEILAVRAFHLLLDPRRRFDIRQQRPVLRRRADIPQSVQRRDAESTDRRGRRARRQHSHTFDKVQFHEIPPFSVCSQMPVLFPSIAQIFPERYMFLQNCTVKMQFCVFAGRSEFSARRSSSFP